MPDPTLFEVIAQWLASATGASLLTTQVLVWTVVAAVIAGLLLALAGMNTYFMRKIMARVQQRVGPNRVGPFGLLQFLADGLKLVSKEDITPAKADRWSFSIAPYLLVVPIVVSFAPIPWGPGIILADLRVGLLLILAISAAAPLGELVAGWASNNKYSMTGALRAAAMDVSYEIPMVLSALAIVILTGSLSTQDIVAAQHGLWFFALQPLGAFIFFTGALAKAGVVPMDLPEAESELVGGFATEYSGMRFGVFFVGIFVNIILISVLMVLLFFGGWSMPGMPGIIPAWTGLLWFALKVFVVVAAVITVWFTLPRIRIDQFLTWGWKVLLPLSILNLVVAVAQAFYITGGT